MSEEMLKRLHTVRRQVDGGIYGPYSAQSIAEYVDQGRLSLNDVVVGGEAGRCRVRDIIGASTSPPPSLPRATTGTSTRAVANTSGQGKDAILPPEVARVKWCWGMFGCGIVWIIGNNVWWGLLVLVGLIPYVGWVVAWGVQIYLWIKGYEWAWRSRRFDSLEQFQDTMQVWDKWGIGITIASLVIGLVMGLAVVAVG